MKFMDKYQKFMNGRYGVDELSKLLTIIYVILAVFSLFIDTYILILLRLVILVIIIYRLLSKKIVVRKKENKIYLEIKNKILNMFKRKKKDSNYIYRKCHYCHKKLRLPIPLKIGIKHSTCPICKKKNTFIILKKQKIEIIK